MRESITHFDPAASVVLPADPAPKSSGNVTGMGASGARADQYSVAAAVESMRGLRTSLARVFPGNSPLKKTLRRLASMGSLLLLLQQPRVWLAGILVLFVQMGAAVVLMLPTKPADNNGSSVREPRPRTAATTQAHKKVFPTVESSRPSATPEEEWLEGSPNKADSVEGPYQSLAPQIRSATHDRRAAGFSEDQSYAVEAETTAPQFRMADRAGNNNSLGTREELMTIGVAKIKDEIEVIDEGAIGRFGDERNP